MYLVVAEVMCKSWDLLRSDKILYSVKMREISWLAEEKVFIIIPTNAQLVLLYTVRLHVSTFIGHHQGTIEYQRL
jgi:hypothetical protein